MNSLLNYLKAVQNELSHVSWPSRNQAIGYTTLVIGISLFIAALLGAFDFVFTFLIEELIRIF